MKAKESREEPFFAAGDAARCWDRGSAGMLQAWSFSGGLQKGSQTQLEERQGDPEEHLKV